MTGKNSNPHAQFMGFELLTKYNNEHPDGLHRDWMKRNGIPLPGGQKKRGRRPGAKAKCSRCGRKGHYAKACKHGVDINGKPLWNY